MQMRTANVWLILSVFVLMLRESLATPSPSSKPSRKPSGKPSKRPSSRPSFSSKPSSRPSKRPSSKPSTRPSKRPSSKPSSRPSKRPSTPAPTPSPIRQARVLITVDTTQALSVFFIVAYENACGQFLTDLPVTAARPETTCKVGKQQLVGSTGPVVLTVLVEADVPGLDVLVFANTVTNALNDPRFTVPLDVTGTVVAPPTFVTIVTITIDQVENGRLTPGGIDVFQEACREFFTIRVGNPNFRCLIIGGSGVTDDNNDPQRFRRSLQSSSPISLEVNINAGEGSNPTQPNTQSGFTNAVGGALSNDSQGLLQDTQDRADGEGVTDYRPSTTATATNRNQWEVFLAIIGPIIRLIIRAYGGGR